MANKANTKAPAKKKKKRPSARSVALMKVWITGVFGHFPDFPQKTEQAFWEKRKRQSGPAGIILLRKEMRNVFHF